VLDELTFDALRRGLLISDEINEPRMAWADYIVPKTTRYDGPSAETARLEHVAFAPIQDSHVSRFVVP
jgi:hypothetical protein